MSTRIGNGYYKLLFILAVLSFGSYSSFGRQGTDTLYHIKPDPRTDSLVDLLYLQIEQDKFSLVKETLLFIADHQNKVSGIEELHSSVGLTPKDSLEVYDLNYKARKKIFSHSDSAKILAHLALEGSRRTHDVRGAANAYQTLATLHMYDGEIKESLITAARAYGIWSYIDRGKGFSGVYKIMANTFFYDGKIGFAKFLLKESLVINRALKDISSVVIAYNNLGAYCKQAGQYDSAEFYYKKALHLNQGKGKKGLRTEATLLGNLGQVLEETGRYVDALEYLEAAFEINKKIGNVRHNIVVSLDIGDAHRFLGNYDAAIQAYFEARDLAREIRDVKAICAIFSDLGDLYLEMKDYDVAYEYFIRGLEDALANDLNRETGQSYADLGEFYKRKNDWLKSQNYYQKSLEQFEKSSYYKGSGLVLLALAEIDHRHGDKTAANNRFREAIRIFESKKLNENLAMARTKFAVFKIDQGQLDTAYHNLLIALALVEKEKNTSLLLDIYKNLSTIEEAKGWYEKASTHRRRQLELRDSIFSKDQALEIGRLEAKSEIQSKEFEILRLTQKKEQEGQLRILYLGIGILLCIIFFLVLISYRAKLKHEKRNLQAQKEIDQMRSRFFANISHEQRTPLALISGTLKQLIESEGLRTKEKKWVDRVIDQTDHLIQMADDVMHLSRLEAKKLELAPGATNLYKLLARLVSNFESVATYRKIKFAFECSFDRDIWVNIDQEHFPTIVNNLISNALKFTSTGGTIDVGGHLNSSNELELTIKDTGKGIPLEEQHDIFRRYYQVKGDDQIEEGGVGIGLALVRELTLLMGGKIDLQSIPDKGTTFKLFIPIERTEPKEEPQETETYEREFIEFSNAIASQDIQKNPDKKGKVLVVEDHPEMCRYLNEIISPQYTVILAENGKAAFDKLRSANKSIDLMITDVMMPEVDGFTLVERVRSDTDFVRLPIIMLTARNELQDKMYALRIGVEDYMTKPFDREELLIRVENLVKRSKVMANLANDGDSQIADASTIQETDLSVNMRLLKNMENIFHREIGNAKYTALDLSEELNIPERSLRRKVKQMTGLGVNQFFRELRLIQAKNMLISGEYHSVSEVSYAVGFDSPGYFTKMFYQRFGKKPSSYIYDRID